MNVNKLLWMTCAIGFMFFPSFVYFVQLDGAGANYYGFPLPWNSDGLANSLTKEIYIIPLFIDVVVYLALGKVFFKFFWLKLSGLEQKCSMAIVVLIWMYGLFGLMMMILMLFSIGDVQYSLWYHDVFRIVSLKISVNV
jgi:hypothetical protein